MIDVRTSKDIKGYPILEEPKVYIYVMLNNVGKVKIGRTRNMQKRYQSLCGSNGQGNCISQVYVSPPTFLSSLENIMHSKFNNYRIPRTEWFYDEEDSIGETLFSNAVNELESLFSSAEYKKCNDVRKRLYEVKIAKDKGGD